MGWVRNLNGEVTMRGMLVLFYHFYWFIRVDRAFPYVIKTFVGKFNLTLNIQRGEEKKKWTKKYQKKRWNTSTRCYHSQYTLYYVIGIPRIMKTILQIRQDFGLHICGVCIYMYLLQESCFPRMQKRETIEREKSGSFWCVYISIHGVKIKSD